MVDSISGSNQNASILVIVKQPYLVEQKVSRELLLCHNKKQTNHQFHHYKTMDQVQQVRKGREKTCYSVLDEMIENTHEESLASRGNKT